MTPAESLKIELAQANQVVRAAHIKLGVAEEDVARAVRRRDNLARALDRELRREAKAA